MTDIDRGTEAEDRDRPGNGTGAQPGGRRNWILLLGGVVAVMAVVFFLWRWWESGRYASTDDAFVGGDMVPVLARVNGYVQSVTVRENDHVAKGQLLVQLDTAELSQRLRQAEADLAVARSVAGSETGGGTASAEVAAARAAEAAARAAVEEAEASAEKTSSDVERLRPLADREIVSKQQFEAALAARRAAAAQLQAARERAQAAEAQAEAARTRVAGARGRAAAAEAIVEQARLQLGYARIVAPAEGVVARKNVEVGQLVNAGQSLMTVVPLSDIWVTANLKETQLKGVGPGDRVEIEVDAYPGLTFHGRVESVSPATGAQFSLLPPDNATGNFTKVVQRIPLRVRLDGHNPDVQLRPGMSAVVTIRKEG